jgi:hypothetical protein
LAVGVGWGVIKHDMCLLIFSTTFVCKFLILRRSEREIIRNIL